MNLSQVPSRNTPFDQDIEKKGAYVYTDQSLLSARMANERYTKIILSCANFAGKSVVDVGSGDGTYTAEIAQCSGAASVLGVEPSAKAVERAAAIYRNLFPRLKFKCGSSEMLLREKPQFDIAVYRGVLHHVPDPKEEIRRAVALAGTVILLEPNGLNPLMKLMEKISFYHRQHQEWSFVPQGVGRWVLEAGGGVCQIRFFGLVPYFCPDFTARIGRFLEPAIESVPWFRSFACGQYVIVSQRGRG